MKTQSDRNNLPRRFAGRQAVWAIVVPGCVALGAASIVLCQPRTAARAQLPGERIAKAPAAQGQDGSRFELPPITKENSSGGTKNQRSVAAALYWFAKHQTKEGYWSLSDYTQQCKDKTCKGVAYPESFSAATALGVLPFLAARQTQTKNGPFQRSVSIAIDWLLNHQKADGDLSAGDNVQMYSHGLATLALCEDYNFTRDKTVGTAAQKAIHFIEAAQDNNTGGWRFHPKDECDTSVFGWQLIALQSARLAGLKVKQATFDGAKKWLKSCGGDGADLGKFSYRPGDPPDPAMSAIGLLSNQILGVGRTDPVITGGIKYLMANQPDAAKLDRYYWFFATTAMHNVADKDWDAWNRNMRKIFIDGQVREGCATGSWNCAENTKHAWGGINGRIMQTSLCCLSLEVYYAGYMPLYRLDKP